MWAIAQLIVSWMAPLAAYALAPQAVAKLSQNPTVAQFIPKDKSGNVSPLGIILVAAVILFAFVFIVKKFFKFKLK